MDELRVNDRIRIPEDELHVSFARSGGAGGQKVNKTSTKVELRWHPASSRALSEHDRAWLLRRVAGKLTSEGELVVVSERTRTQAQNRADARDKLAALVQEALRRPKRRRPTKRTRASVERRLEAKRRRSKLKEGRRTRDD